MAWNKPIIREIECGMEINMYGPDADDDGVLF
ncbi:pyrroloquinoline quinone precursor peptide PqqA [Sulfitobacter sp. BDSS02]|nr:MULTISPECIES: pyrroloquinoline quinone precursor peptide PqqA [Roseobacteraceae]MBL3704423.1 pyrroloquinoline quinone precursor peptide PqqA [Sulfitobacter sp. BDSS02]MBR9849708.1 pyrroloquinoline quinone precursor peptide PqqA [Paracoccaceae bacterium]OWU78106.1 pyrroloquinoline quinone biosynthesis protein PqqA [Phaeobacter sp. 22II1-1F12B]